MRKGISVEWLPISSLLIDESVQRRAISSRVKYLTVNFNSDKVSTPPLVVSLRTDGHYYVVDGQHRVLAARAAGRGELRVKCDIKRELARAEEARLFLGANDSRSVSQIDKYAVSLVAGDPRTLAIDEIVVRHGWQVGHAAGDNGRLRCVQVLYRLYDDGVLGETLAVSNEAFGGRSEGAEQIVLGGLGLVLSRYNGALNRARLTQKLAKRKGGAAGLIADARALSSIRTISKTRALAEVVVELYNQRCGDGTRLPPL